MTGDSNDNQHSTAVVATNVCGVVKLESQPFLYPVQILNAEIFSDRICIRVIPTNHPCMTND